MRSLIYSLQKYTNRTIKNHFSKIGPKLWPLDANTNKAPQKIVESANRSSCQKILGARIMWPYLLLLEGSAQTYKEENSSKTKTDEKQPCPCKCRKCFVKNSTLEVKLINFFLSTLNRMKLEYKHTILPVWLINILIPSRGVFKIQYWLEKIVNQHE